MNYAAERENNIIKNIAKEVEGEGLQIGLTVSPDLAVYMVKLKMLNPKNGFTATEVMPRNRIQQLVMMVIEDLKQDNPSINCIRMQVYWGSIEMNIDTLKREFLGVLTSGQERYIQEILVLDYEEARMVRDLAICTLEGYRLGDPTFHTDLKETMAAVHSVFKHKDMEVFLYLPDEEKKDVIDTTCARVAGIRLYLKFLGKAGEGIAEVNDLPLVIEDMKMDITRITENITAKIESIREVISILIPFNFTNEDLNGVPQGTIQHLPQDCDENDVKYLKQVLVIMLQHRDYLSDIMSKVDEIDGGILLFLDEFEQVMERLKATIRDRDAVLTTEVFDDFEKAGEIWRQIQSYVYCLETVQDVSATLEGMNKEEYYDETNLEKSFTLTKHKPRPSIQRSSTSKSFTVDIKLLNDLEEVYFEFNGYCPWILYYTEGLLCEAFPYNGIHEFEGQHFQFSSPTAYELWSRSPKYCLMKIYKCMRENPELIDYLKAYDNLHHIRTLLLEDAVDQKVTSHAASIQTDVHPIKKHWDKDYAFSIWDLKKRALTLSRLVKCVTKSVQTVSPHSHFRASIGLLAAPKKDKDVQTKRDSHCNHSTVSTYLYGLRGHKENKFCVVDLTKPVEESFQKKIVLGKRPCRRPKKNLPQRKVLSTPPPSATSTEKGTYSFDEFGDYLYNYVGEY